MEKIWLFFFFYNKVTHVLWLLWDIENRIESWLDVDLDKKCLNYPLMAPIAHPAEGSVRGEQDRNYEGLSTCVLSPSDLTSSDIYNGEIQCI